jgi:hypothetical protein
MATAKLNRRNIKTIARTPKVTQTRRVRAETTGTRIDQPLAAKTADNKGRIALGSRFANRAVIIETVSDTEVVVKLARVIPESEAWLYENPEALSAVRAGLSQARARQVSQGPALDRDVKLAHALEE